MMKLQWQNVRVCLGELKPWADNPRMSTKAQAQRILKSFNQYGQVQTIAIDPDNNVLDGHQRLSALLTIHGADYQVDARRSNRPLADDERRGLIAALHLGATGSWDWDLLSGWDADLLGEWGADEQMLKNWNNDANNLKEMLASEIDLDFLPFLGDGDGGGSQMASGTKLRVVIGPVMFDIDDSDHALYAAAKNAGADVIREAVIEILLSTGGE